MKKYKTKIAMLKGGKETLEVEIITKPVPHIILDQSIPIRGWYKPKVEKKGRRPRPCYSEAILTTPYGGRCPVGCTYCYVNNGTRGYRSTGFATVDPNYPEKVRDQLAKLHVVPQFYITSFSEPFHPLEEEYHVTERLSKYITEAGAPLFYLTRMVPPEWAWGYLKANKHNYLQMSINTSVEADWKRMSPGAPTLKEMYGVIKRASSEGIYTSIQVNPVIAGITSEKDIAELMRELAAAGANHVIFKFVEIVYPSVKGLIEKFEARFPEDRVEAFKSLFTQNVGGVKTIEEEYRRHHHEQMMKLTKALGLTMSMCYEYTGINGKAGESMGPDFTSSAQCHGFAAPMYYRDSLDEKFQPLDDCCGVCLYCKDPVCGIPELQEAGAHSFPQLKKMKINRD